MNVLAIFIGGGLGSLCRFGISKLMIKLTATNFPLVLGTFISNMLSCIIIAFAVVYFTGNCRRVTYLTAGEFSPYQFQNP